MYFVYWIKRKNYTDPENEGYIGFSNNPVKRFEQHKKKNSRSKVQNAIARYDDIELEIIFESEQKEDALKKEKQLRPKKYIGWNIAIGGQVPPAVKDDAETKKKIQNTLKALGVTPYCDNTHSPAAKEKRTKGYAAKQQRIFHCPITGEYKNFATGYGEMPPDSWVPGRVKKKIYEKKIHIGNTRNWTVFKNNIPIWTGKNIKQYSIDNNVSGLTHEKAIVRKEHSSITSKLSCINGFIYESDINTGLQCKQWAEEAGISYYTAYHAYRRGFYILNFYDVYTCKKDTQR